MSETFFLRIGGTELMGGQLVADLESTEGKTKEKAEAALTEKLKEARVRIGTLLKMDNVSFLIGAGASMAAGGVGLACIPRSLECALVKKARESPDNADMNWIALFFTTCSMLAGQLFSLDERHPAHSQAPTPDPEIPINLEVYLNQLHIWRAGIVNTSEKITIGLTGDASTAMKKSALDDLIIHVTRALTSLVDLPAPGKGDTLKTHCRFIKRILTRPLNLRRANLFTLNYDTLIEKAADGRISVFCRRGGQAGWGGISCWRKEEVWREGIGRASGCCARMFRGT